MLRQLCSTLLQPRGESQGKEQASIPAESRVTQGEILSLDSREAGSRVDRDRPDMLMEKWK
jgi:hypothetical protein